jgi:hypothetical protein
MTILSRALGGVLLSLVVTSADADIMLGATPPRTGDNVVFNLQSPNQTGTMVLGNINNAANTLVQFTSTQTLGTAISTICGKFS